MTVPLGLVIPIGAVVTRVFITCAVIVQKWAVLPLSAMAVALGGRSVGGPTVGEARLDVQPAIAFKTLMEGGHKANLAQ
jgi:hypothetical protein